ncbi:MAG: transcription-repair coupling factor [Burkholderia sp.]|nr:transcription-repair coupling factor [Burkholderia sp.]
MFLNQKNVLSSYATLDHASILSASPINLIKRGNRFVFNGAYGSADSLAIARYARSYSEKIPLIVVICENAVNAHRILHEINYFTPGVRIRLLPGIETLPYDNFSPKKDLISERLSTMQDLIEGCCDILIVDAMTALYRMPPVSFIASHTFSLIQGEKIDEENIKVKLMLAAYKHVNKVLCQGEYCIRKASIDLFPIGLPLPYRIDLFDNQINSIHSFDPKTKKSLYQVSKIRILPGQEFPFDEASRIIFNSHWQKIFEGNHSCSPIYRDINNIVLPAGIEHYFPLFFNETETLFHYLPRNTHLIFVGNIDSAIRQFTDDTKQRYRLLSHDLEKPILEPKKLFLNHDDFFILAKSFSRILIPTLSKQDVSSWTTEFSDLSVNRLSIDPFDILRTLINTSGKRILLTVKSIDRSDRLYQLLTENNIKPKVVNHFSNWLDSEYPFSLCVAPILNGFSSPQEGFAIVTESELFNGIQTVAPKGNKYHEQIDNINAIVSDLYELKINDPVVHAHHGIGRYLGLISMDLGEGETEFLHLKYSENSKLYVPVTQLCMISRYIGLDQDSVPLHTLGSKQWDIAKRRAVLKIYDTAAELLNLYARRATREGYAFSLDPRNYMKFVENFGFDETPDQAAAIAAVIGDMTSGKLMDRLVCGDVGFGKTEIALRAAFIAAMNGKQVVLLSPTTVLAKQHMQTFSNRFAGWPVQIVELSRFKSIQEMNTSITQINEGSANIVIGTHKLLSPDVQFKNLGLVIIDEEHRFGVRQKEALKELRTEVDILTLTATPIPRSLSMALEGFRDLSIISTAPQKRLAIKTFVCREEKSVIREAMLRELNRGGQVYFLHNEVETIENRLTMLKALIPEAKIGIANGQMRKYELERIMHDFIMQRVNVLLCTTIIETGIDVPNVNTIIIHRADKFGLAQLHQLRGRVGRSHHQAYAYLLVHDIQTLKNHAQRRLEAIQQMGELGSGFYLSMYDLEIRGTGEILGNKQSGNIHEIGFQLYVELLSNAVKVLKSGNEKDLSLPLSTTTEINLHAPALLPANYCVDVQERLSLYKRLANCEHEDKINNIEEELIDRFGKIPPQGNTLIETHRLRLTAKRLGIIKIDASEAKIDFEFAPNPLIDPIKIIDILKKYKHIKFAGKNRLRTEICTQDCKIRASIIREILYSLEN